MGCDDERIDVRHFTLELSRSIKHFRSITKQQYDSSMMKVAKKKNPQKCHVKVARIENKLTQPENPWIYLTTNNETYKTTKIYGMVKKDTHFSRCSRHIRSLATFSFLATIFFRFSTDVWLSTLTEKQPPVVVLIFNVICGKFISLLPHPMCCWISCESLPIFGFFCCARALLCVCVCEFVVSFTTRRGKRPNCTRRNIHGARHNAIYSRLRRVSLGCVFGMNFFSWFCPFATRRTHLSRFTFVWLYYIYLYFGAFFSGWCCSVYCRLLLARIGGRYSSSFCSRVCMCARAAVYCVLYVWKRCCHGTKAAQIQRTNETSDNVRYLGLFAANPKI